MNFWHEYTTTGGKLKTPIGGWINLTNRIWHWYYNKERDKLYHISGTTIKFFKQASGWQCTHLSTTYQILHVETSAQIFPAGIPTSVIQISESKMNKLQEGPLPPPAIEDSTPCWEFIDTWGGVECGVTSTLVINPKTTCSGSQMKWQQALSYGWLKYPMTGRGLQISWEWVE